MIFKRQVRSDKNKHVIFYFCAEKGVMDASCYLRNANFFSSSTTKGLFVCYFQIEVEYVQPGHNI